jgi:hypothetical protein
MTMGLSPATSAVFLVANNFGKMWVSWKYIISFNQQIIISMQNLRLYVIISAVVSLYTVEISEKPDTKPS